MYNNNNRGGPGSGWVPGMGMPPFGFGVVAQQPGGSRMMAASGQQMVSQAQQMPAWQQQQQFMAAQMGMASSAVGVQPVTHHHPQQHGFHQYQQPAQLFQQQQYQQQQQWVEAQKKAVEEQRKMYDQLVKQRQFDEQKMRLKAFSSSKKGGVSADSMIENILGPKDSQKPKSPPAPKKVGSESNSSMMSATARQGTAADWSKMDDINTLFATPKENISSPNMPSTISDSTSLGMSAHPAGESHSVGANSTVILHGNAAGEAASCSESVVICAGNATGANVGCTAPNKKPLGKPINLPSWLSDKSNVPAVYKQSVLLVEGKDGWVDTSRAYMLLMKTGLPPPFLGVLWEMVNRTQPGQLTDQEFTTLLALIALVQAGQAITSTDVLSSTTEPFLPVIDHPALLPLVQDYLQYRQQIQQQQIQGQQMQEKQVHQNQQEQQSANTGCNVWKDGVTVDSHQSSKTGDDDEFDDFVSCTTSTVDSVQDSKPVLGSLNSNLNVGGSVQSSETSMPIQNPLLPSIDKVKRMNLPELGCSPEISPSTSFDQAHDDDFDDFQSATMTNVPSASFGAKGESSLNGNILSANNVNQSNSSEDKYAVFRELDTSEDTINVCNSNSLSYETGNNVDDSFGDFCSSEPASLNLASSSISAVVSSNTAGSGTNSTTPVSFEVFSTPPEVPETSVDAQFEADFGMFSSSSTQPPSNYADIHEAMRRVEAEQKIKNASNWGDPFGEFEDASTSTQVISQPVPQLNVASNFDDNDDDDFGDFMGPDGGFPEPDSLSINQVFPRLSEGLGETQSVASLELPGLEMTVGLQLSESRGSGSGQSPDIFMQARNEISGVEDQLRGLALESSLTPPDGGCLGSSSVNGTGGVAPTAGTNPVLDSFSGSFMDKYSIIRDEASKNSYDEAHTGSWQRCLESSIKLLEQGRNTLVNLTAKKLKTEVLATSQMQDYLANLQEVWYVCERISTSSQHVTTSIKVDQLLSEAKGLWQEIMADSQDVLVKAEIPEGENQMNESEVCGVCLAGGGSKLTYGGHSYHPPCANLWLNCVDLLLPSLTPVTLL